MSKLLNTVWAKISFAIVVLIMFIMAMVTYIFTISQVQTQRSELQTNMARLAKQIAAIRLAEIEGQYVYQDWIDNIINSDFSSDLVYIAIFDEQDSLRASALNYGWLDLEAHTFLSRAEQAKIVVRLSRDQIAPESAADFGHVPVDIRWGDEYLGVVDVGFSLIHFNNMVQRRLYLNLALLGLFSLVGIIGSVIMGKRLTRPLNRLAEAMRAISHGDLNQKLPIHSSDEIGKLAESFHSMLDGLKEKALIESFSRGLSFHFELEAISTHVTDYLMRAVRAHAGLFFIVEKAENQRIARCLTCRPSALIGDQRIPLTDDFIRFCADKKICTCDQSSDLSAFAFVREVKERFPGELGLCLSIYSKDEPLGLLLLGSREDNRPLSAAEHKFIITLCTQAALALENAQLLQEQTEQERLKRELEIARMVQQRLLPTRMPRIAGLDISGICLPATEVGGDYYDFYPLDDRHLGIAIADVSGKGTSAAFYMAEIKGMMTSLSGYVQSPAELVSVLNRRLYESFDRQMFATLIYGVFDLDARTFCFVRAGHSGLMVHNPDNHQPFAVHLPSGMGLGLTDSELFDRYLQEETFVLQDGDRLLFFTDGISEARNPRQDEFGEDRLARVLIHHGQSSAHDLQEDILRQVAEFSQASPHDDIALIVVCVQSPDHDAAA